MYDMAQEAKDERDRTIAILQACTCHYPIRKARQPSGHPSSCPANTLWEAHRRMIRNMNNSVLHEKLADITGAPG